MLIRDLRLAVRHLRLSPGYAAAAAGTLALAIGANSAIFSAVKAVLLHPLPVTRPQDLAVIWQTDEGGQAVVELTHRHLGEWKSAGRTFERAALVASHNWSAVLQDRGETSRIWFAGVSGDYFDTLGATPLVGRALRPSDDVPNGPNVVVLNYNTWVRRFGSNPDVVGTSMMLDGQLAEIVGVMKPGLDVPRGAEFWAPVVPILMSGPTPNQNLLDAVGVFYVLGRLRPGLDVNGARPEIDGLEASLDAAAPGRLKWGSRTVATTFSDYLYGPIRPVLHALWAAVAVLLVVACANVSGLVLTRVSLRRREHAVRQALGATPWALARLWVAETAVLAVAGGVLGLMAAHWLAKGIAALAPEDLPHVTDIAIDAPVAGFTFLGVLAAAIITSLLPARHASSPALAETLDGGRVTASRGTLRVRSLLLVAEIGLAVVLLVATGLVVRSFVELRRIDLGFVPDRVLTATVQPRGSDQPPNVWLDRFLTRVRALPMVESAGTIALRPLMLGPIGQGVRVTLEGQPETGEVSDRNPTLNHQIASHGYFETMRIPLRSGRLFHDRDVAGQPRVAIVSETTARRLWPGQEPLGKRLRMSAFSPGQPPAWRTVVGVVSDVRYRGLDEVQLDVYDPALQVGQAADTVVIRTSGQPMAAVGAVRALARELDAGVIFDAVTTMDRVVARAQAPWRLSTWMFVLFGGMAFALSVLGLFSLVALDVTNRRREHAIRLTLGATRQSLVARVLRRAGFCVGAGVVIGALLARLAAETLGSFLFGISPGDGLTYVSVIAIVVVVVTVAALLPALRASRVNPQVLQRSE